MLKFINKRVNTSDATATVDDVIAPKTFYNDGQKLIGKIQPEYIDIDVTLNNRSISISSSLQIVCTIPDIDLRYVFTSNGVGIYRLNNTLIKNQILVSNIRSVDTISIGNKHYLCIDTHINNTTCGIYVYRIDNTSGDLTQIYNDNIVTGEHWGGQHRLASAYKHPWFALCSRSGEPGSYLWIWHIDPETDIVSLKGKYGSYRYNMDITWLKWTNDDKYIIAQGYDYNYNYLFTIDTTGVCTDNNISNKCVWDIISDNLACDISSNGTLRYCQWTYPRTMSVLSSINTGRTDWQNICYLPTTNTIVLLGNYMRAYKINRDNSLTQLFETSDHYQAPNNGVNFNQLNKFYGITNSAFTNVTNEFYTINAGQKLTSLIRINTTFYSNEDSDGTSKDLLSNKILYNKTRQTIRNYA